MRKKKPQQNPALTIDMVFSGRAATGGGATSRSESSAAAPVIGDLQAFYNHTAIIHPLGDSHTIW